MNITKIELLNFRNYSKKIFDNFTNLNIIIGKNGIGKTSILESIYLGSLAKSFKTNNETSVIKEGQSFYKIKITYFDYIYITLVTDKLSDKNLPTVNFINNFIFFFLILIFFFFVFFYYNIYTI